MRQAQCSDAPPRCPRYAGPLQAERPKHLKMQKEFSYALNVEGVSKFVKDFLKFLSELAFCQVSKPHLIWLSRS